MLTYVSMFPVDLAVTIAQQYNRSTTHTLDQDEHKEQERENSMRNIG